MALTNFLRQRRLQIDPNTMALGSYTRLPCRRGRPVTQEEMAECLGVSRVWYAKIECDSTVRTSLGLLDRLASTLMVTPEDRTTLFNLAIPELRLANAHHASTGSP